MLRSVFASLMICAANYLTACAHTTVAPAEQAVTFEARDDQTTDAFRGYLMVPENRAVEGSRMIKLEYVRFPATGEVQGAPIIYLAGGPGGSGIATAKGRRFPLFMAMRQFGDVIAFDQRGTGASNDMPKCVSSQFIPDAVPVSDEVHVEHHRSAGEECLGFWAGEGIDIYGYTTSESVRDLDDLRKHLGADKITLWGISYGSHLSLAALKEMDDRIDRVVLASVEGLDQTVKYPARTDTYFSRLQAVVNTDDALKTKFSDIAGLLKRVHARLDAAPLMVNIPQEDGTTSPYLLQRRAAQMMMSGLIADPQLALMGLGVYADIDEGKTERLAGLLARWHTPNEPITFRPMSFAMDIASGTGEVRKQQIEVQARTSLLAGYLNFPMPQLEGVFPGFDLGDAFRSAPVSDVPALVLSGTLDGRTYIESQREAVAGLSAAEIVTVENAGHNLFMASPDVTQRIEQFMRGETSDVDTIRIDLPF